MSSKVPLLSVKDLSVAFTQAGRTTLAVDRISFDVGPRETVALVGESGSGKSVTARSLVGLAGAGSRVSAERLDHLGH